MNEIVETNPVSTASPELLAALALPSAEAQVQALNIISANSPDAQLKFHINVVTTFLGLLGLGNPTTAMYVDALKTYVPRKVAVKAEKAYDAKKALNALLKAESLDVEALSALAADGRTPADMKAVIVGHTTLLGVEGMNEDIIAFSFKKLRSFAVKAFTGSRQPKEKFTVAYTSSTGAGGSYGNLMQAIKEGAGYSQAKLVGDSNRPETDVIWNKLRPMLLKHGTATHTDGAAGVEHTFTKVPVENEAQ
jgi:hypothetical protein